MKISKYLILSTAVSSVFTLLIVGAVIKKPVENALEPSESNVPFHTVKNNTINTSSAPNFVAAAENSIDAVVHIETGKSKKGKYYRNLYGQLFYEAPKNKYQKTGNGSGVIISADGYVATNYHVIKGAQIIKVSLNDKRSYSAKVIGKDPNTDLALLKITAEDLPTIKYGNSENVKVGEWALAVGNPFNLNSTVTAGIVSAKGRNINLLKEQYAIESFIQTDAAVNPGNSGGALVNTKGELIGINTAIASNTGSYTGYSFAIPVNVVQKVMNDLRKYKKVQRALLGIQISDVNERKAKELNLRSISGVYISKVFAGTAADKAHLQRGDIITSINGKLVSSSTSLQEILGQTSPGDQITLSYWRNDKIYETDVSFDVNLAANNTEKTEQKYGIDTKQLSKKEQLSLGITGGIMIQQVKKGVFKNAGVKNNFIITKVNKVSISSLRELEEELEKTTGGVLIEGLYPNGTTAYYGFGL